MLLKRLVDVLPPNLAKLVPDLEAASIKTTESVIFTSPPTLLDLVPTLYPYELDALVSACIKYTAPKLEKGNDILEELDDEDESSRGWRGFGIPGLDSVLRGWDGIGVIQIAGPRKVGKSLLALHGALRILVDDPTAICRWIDTEASFAPERARAILETWDVDGTQSVLSRIVVVPCFQLEDVFKAVAALDEEKTGNGGQRTAVLVIDTIHTHFKDLLMSTSVQGHAELISLMGDIAELTYSRDLLSIVINSTASSQPTNLMSAFNKIDIKPSLGTAFTYCTDATLLVQETGRVFGLMDEEERERIRRRPGLRALVEVIRSRVSPSGQWAVFETDGTQLFDVLPPHEVDERATRISAGLSTGPARPIHGPLAQTMIP